MKVERTFLEQRVFSHRRRGGGRRGRFGGPEGEAKELNGSED
jgi:hypothetical protein